MGACSSQFSFNRKKGKSSGEEEQSIESEQKPDSQNDLDSNGKPVLSATSNGPSIYNSLSVSSNFSSDRLISACELYNILNDSGIRPHIHGQFNFLVLDGRNEELFTSSHVVTAQLHSKFMSNSKRRESLPKYALIVIYGEEIKEDTVIYGEELKADKPSHQLLMLMQQIEEYVVCDILVLRDGFDAFNKQFPYLCTDQDVDSIDDRKLLLCYPSAVIDGLLYQGRGDQARNEKIMTTLGITHVVNISEHTNTFPHKIEYLRLPLDDNVATNLSQHFNETYDFIKEACESGGCVLIHCNLGISRSSTITLAYLMKNKKWNLKYAFNFLKAKRTCASPNSGFLRQLSEWEVEIFGEKHTDTDAILKTYGSLR